MAKITDVSPIRVRAILVEWVSGNWGFWVEVLFDNHTAFGYWAKEEGRPERTASFSSKEAATRGAETHMRYHFHYVDEERRWVVPKKKR